MWQFVVGCSYSGSRLSVLGSKPMWKKLGFNVIALEDKAQSGDGAIGNVPQDETPEAECRCGM